MVNPAGEVEREEDREGQQDDREGEHVVARESGVSYDALRPRGIELDVGDEHGSHDAPCGGRPRQANAREDRERLHVREELRTEERLRGKAYRRRAGAPERMGEEMQGGTSIGGGLGRAVWG